MGFDKNLQLYASPQIEVIFVADIVSVSKDPWVDDDYGNLFD